MKERLEKMEMAKMKERLENKMMELCGDKTFADTVKFKSHVNLNWSTIKRAVIESYFEQGVSVKWIAEYYHKSAEWVSEVINASVRNFYEYSKRVGG